MAGQTITSTVTSMTGTARLGQNAGSIRDGSSVLSSPPDFSRYVSDADKETSDAITRSTGGIDKVIGNAGSAVKSQMARGAQAATAAVARAFRGR